MRIGNIVLVCCGLIGCSDSAPRPGPQVAAFDGTGWSFRCPPSGYRITTSVGGSIEYLGADPAEPTVCLGKTQGGIVRRPFAVSELASQDPATVRREIGKLYPARPGGEVRFIGNGQGGIGGTQFNYSWKVLGFERISLAGMEIDALMLQVQQQGLGDNYHNSKRTYWLDRTTGAVVKMQVTLIAGSLGGWQSWEAISISLDPTT